MRTAAPKRASFIGAAGLSVRIPRLGLMADSPHVFVSYVHEDSDRVDLLCKVLEAAQIPYWRDRNNLGPGDAWKSKIREAIQSNALVFLACFSERSKVKAKSHMNEELTLAVEEFRAMPPGRTWLMPIRFDDGPVPAWDLGAGRLLGDLNYVDLFGDAHPVQAAALVAAVSRLMGESGPDAATMQAAVAQAVDGDRAVLLRRLTKEMLPDRPAGSNSTTPSDKKPADYSTHLAMTHVFRPPPFQAPMTSSWQRSLTRRPPSGS